MRVDETHGRLACARYFRVRVYMRGSQKIILFLYCPKTPAEGMTFIMDGDKSNESCNT